MDSDQLEALELIAPGEIWNALDRLPFEMAEDHYAALMQEPSGPCYWHRHDRPQSGPVREDGRMDRR
jgi:hypothetical protein